MRYQVFVRTAGALLATVFLGAGAALAQTTLPQPEVMTDAAPLPASERESTGAIILMDQPVLAQREAMAAAQERSVDTRALGAGPSRIMRTTHTKEAIELRKALEEALRREQGMPK